MVNWKMLALSALTYYGSYGVDRFVNNSRLGYDAMEAGVRQADNTIAHAFSNDSSARPILDLIQEHTGVGLRYREPYLTQNDYRAFGVVHTAAGCAQIGAGLGGLLALAGVGSRKKK